MGPTVIVSHPPRFDDRLRVTERGELMHVQTFIAQAPIKRFNEGILHGFTGPNKVELYALRISLILQGSRLELRPIIHRDRPWAWRPVQGSVKSPANRLPRHPNTDF